MKAEARAPMHFTVTCRDASAPQRRCGGLVHRILASLESLDGRQCHIRPSVTTWPLLLLVERRRGREEKCITTMSAEPAVAAQTSLLSMNTTRYHKKCSRAGLWGQGDGCRAGTRTDHTVGGP